MSLCITLLSNNYSYNLTSVNLNLKNPDGSEMQTMNSDGESRTVAEAIRQTQQEMIAKNHPGMAHRFEIGRAHV